MQKKPSKPFCKNPNKETFSYFLISLLFINNNLHAGEKPKQLQKKPKPKQNTLSGKLVKTVYIFHPYN